MGLFIYECCFGGLYVSQIQWSRWRLFRLSEGDFDRTWGYFESREEVEHFMKKNKDFVQQIKQYPDEYIDTFLDKYFPRQDGV